MLTWKVLDLETTYSEDYGRVSNQLIETNQVVRTGILSHDSPVMYCLRNTIEQLKTYHNLLPVDWFIPYVIFSSYTRQVEFYSNSIPGSLFDCDIIVAHNSKFEIMWLLRYQWDKVCDFISKGGIIWCTQFTEYQLSGKTTKLASLEKVALKYGGFKKYDKIKEYWQAGIKTEEIPHFELDYYLHYDCHNTMKAFLGQFSQLMKMPNPKRMLESLKHHFGYNYFTSYCEWFGMWCSRAELDTLREQCLVQKAQLEQDIQAVIHYQVPAEHLPYFELDKNFHVSALLYGGEWKYKIGTENVYKSGKKAGQTYYRWKEYKIPAKGVGLELNEETATAFKGIGKTDSKFLQWYSSIPFVQKLIDYRRCNQLLKTFLDPEGNGIRGLIHPDDCIHGSLNHSLVSTGRLSSNRPNMQNVDKKSPIRAAFKSRFMDGFIVEADWVGLENSTMAQISHDQALLKDLWDGIDLHSKRAAMMNGYDYPEFIKELESGNKQFKEMRSKAKAPSFAYAYGAGLKKLVEATQLSEEAVKAFIKINKELYPQSVSFYDELYEICKNKARPTNILTKEGNRRFITTWTNMFGWPLVFASGDSPIWAIIREVTRVFGRDYPYLETLKKLNEKVRDKLYPIPEELVSAGIKYTSFTNTVFKNYPNQNLASEIVAKFASMLLTKLLPYIKLKLILPINTIHDSYVFDVYDVEHLEILTNIIKECEEQFPSYLLFKFGVRMEAPLRIEIKSGKTWGN